MTLPVCQFVDRVGSGAVQRLNLNDGERLSLLAGPDQRPGPDFSPPALKRAVVNTLMAEGASIPASAYDNRIIRLPLRVKACDEAEMAETLESLHRELDRGNNILKWHPTYNSRPVYFRTFRSPDYRLDQAMEGRGELDATLAILAEPFAYGDYIEQTGTIYNDPAAVANGLFIEVPVTEGDVTTPLFMYAGDTLGSAVLGVRRHGTPSLYWSQCEAMGQNVDTTIQANDPLMSGPGQNWSRTTFVDPTMQIRLSWDPAPAAGSSVDYRGVYRLFVRVQYDRRSSYNVQATWGGGGESVTNDPVTLGTGAGGSFIAAEVIDLGLVSLPLNVDPVVDGYSNIILPCENTGIWFQAERTAGADPLDWDYAVLVPADEELSVVGWIGNPAEGIYDGPNDKIYVGDMATVGPQRLPERTGSIPLLQPDQTNLLVFLAYLSSAVAKTTAVTIRWWPRHLYIR